MTKNSFYFTSELIEGFSTKEKLSEDLVRDIYYFYMNSLRDSVKNNAHVAYLITNLGTFYLTLSGVNYEIMRNQKSIFNTEFLESKLQAKKIVIQEFIEKLKLNGVIHIPYLRKVFNPFGIKNK